MEAACRPLTGKGRLLIEQVNEGSRISMTSTYEVKLDSSLKPPKTSKILSESKNNMYLVSETHFSLESVLYF